MSDIEIVDDNPDVSRGMLDVAQSRAAQEVQAAMVVAKKFPRDEDAAIARIMRACGRPGLAENALYAYPRGNTTVTGPSIRLAEAMAQAWGNLSCGIIELDQRDGESTVMAYAWDLETNARVDKVFTVKHIRATRQKTYSLTDPRDIYELTANQGARRLRACILAVIPGDIVDAACIECDKTLAGNNEESIQDRTRKMIVAFDKLGVSKDRIEARLGHKTDTMSEAEHVQMIKVFRSITDNMASVEEHFPINNNAAPMTGKAVLEELKPGKPPEQRGSEPSPDPDPSTDPEPEDGQVGGSNSQDFTDEDYAKIEAEEAAAAEAEEAKRKPRKSLEELQDEHRKGKADGERGLTDKEVADLKRLQAKAIADAADDIERQADEEADKMEAAKAKAEGRGDLPPNPQRSLL